MAKQEYPGLDAVKSAKRTQFVEDVIKVLTDRKLYKGQTFSTNESEFVNKLQIPLKDGLVKIFSKEYPGNSEKWCENAADAALICEKDTNVTVNNIQFLGTQHRPDMYIIREKNRQNEYKIALEYKVVTNGDGIRAALGQSLVYSSEYAFTICLLLDVTKDGKIRNAFLNGPKEKRLMDELWDKFGVKFLIVTPDM